ncbi:hypothetical protein A3752_01250 [Oleiphilus sp. HI0081]|uniref:hypothetical protein n=2 Tax=Oleiphilus TaxID=141450 RepID=UPI0007C3A184|nr:MULTISPECIES: hypothetical protein [unclassified Oleiphilus]KZY76414.1 hypothetical protein A3741_11020 [Oleiphilus sp. HI0069]KZY78406.1 hypothetical protein A3740_07660 [Oleiphilus sp. HI0068]KZZ11819.1 hypothetical protein A3749_00900 [Oleiphilus sp. HI0078]KZZ21064.1 hypothetical protein A3752_01250 [Oleiphilus sp. HI0081]KZY34127.1 hypothetical protein A3729_00255 [Oleiphilus sp. HI0043]
MSILLRSVFAKAVLAVVLGGTSLVSFATEAKKYLVDHINWHGFVSQSFVLTDENDFLGSSSDGSFKYNSVGLNGSWKATNSLQFSMQGLYKQIGNGEPKGTRLDFAILDWRLFDDFEYGLGLRAGRLKNPFGFFNETRDVAVTRPSLLLPESIYIDYLQEILHSSDSIGLYGHREFQSGTLSFSTAFGEPIFNSHSVESILSTKTSGSFDNERASFTRLSFEPGSGAWRTALSYVQLDADFTPGAGETFQDLTVTPPLFEGELGLKALMLSFELSIDKWRFTTEIQRRDIEVDNIFAGNKNVEKFIGYYVQVDYQLSPNMQVYVRQDEAYRFKDDKDGSDYEAGDPINRYARNAFAKDSTIGISYAPSFEWMFSIEFHAVNGTFWLPDLENPDMEKQRKHWNMFLAQVAYRF